MNTTLYVGGLPYSSNEESLKTYFAGAGTVVSANVITDRMTSRSRGFGFVEMSSEAEAQNAVSMFDGKEFEGRRLTVNMARPRTERPRRDDRG